MIEKFDNKFTLKLYSPICKSQHIYILNRSRLVAIDL